MRKFIALLLFGAIVTVALHDFYVEQFDKHDTLKQEYHCTHLHHTDFHIHALLPDTLFVNNDFAVRFDFSHLPLTPKHIPSINPPPPRRLF